MYLTIMPKNYTPVTTEIKGTAKLGNGYKIKQEREQEVTTLLIYFQNST